MSKHTLFKQALWTTLFVAGGALAQEAAISGADFTRGNADAQLSAIGRQAAALDKTVVVTAPTYWQGKVAAKIRAGAHGQPVTILFSEGFYENVLVRTEASAAPEVKPEAAAAKAAAKPESKPVVKTAMKPVPVRKPLTKAVPKPRPSETAADVEPIPQVSNKSVTMPLMAPRVAAKPMSTPVQKMSAPPPVAHVAPSQSTKIETVPQVSQRPEVVPIPTNAVNPTGIKSVLPTSQGNTGARQRMLTSLNDGRPATGSIGEAGLQSGDQVYSDGGTLAVVRLEGLHREFYWLEGPVDLQRVQFSPQDGGRYEVTGTIDPKSPAVHRGGAGASHHVVVAAVPSADSPTRARLQQQYNNGQSITAHLGTGQLQPEDRLVTDGNTILVVRREGNSMNRYWLNDSIDLGQSGLQKIDTNVYRVNGNNLH